MLAGDSGLIFEGSAGGFGGPHAWRRERLRWRSLRCRVCLFERGFARAGRRTRLLPRVQLTEGSGAGPGDGWRGGPGLDPSVAVAAADFARCVGDLSDDAPLGDDRNDPHGRAARERAADRPRRRGGSTRPSASGAACARSYRARSKPQNGRRPQSVRRQHCPELQMRRFRRHHFRPRTWTPQPRRLPAAVWPSRPRRNSRSTGSNAFAAPATA
jgi:hypothetical protein